MIPGILAMIAVSFLAPRDSIPGGVSNLPVAEYGCQTLDQYGVQALVPLWGDLGASRRPTPKAPGLPDTVYLWNSDDWKGRLYVIFSKDRAGNVSGPSQGFIVASGPATRDTIFWYVGHTRSKTKNVRYSKPTRTPGIYAVAWDLGYGTWWVTPAFGGLNHALKSLGPVVRDEVLQKLPETWP